MPRRNPNHGYDVIYDDWSQERDLWFDDEDAAISFGKSLADQRDSANPAQYRYASVTVWLDSLDGSRDRKKMFHVDRC